MQWKVNGGCIAPTDVAWLVALSTHRPECCGYALCLDLEPKLWLRCDRIFRGDVEERWLEIE